MIIPKNIDNIIFSSTSILKKLKIKYVGKKNKRKAITNLMPVIPNNE